MKELFDTEQQNKWKNIIPKLTVILTIFD